ncbi:hypothetical protein [Streptomyces sp. NPDC004728]|uniref:hypothetical protein n=1 Tax=Streptomyces sp. NPDC004728 TaxID=3154289 RepID=UPI0033A577CE
MAPRIRIRRLPCSITASTYIRAPDKASADGRDETGRMVAPQQLAIGEWTRYSLTPTSPPSWSASTTDDWRRDHANEPVRLSHGGGGVDACASRRSPPGDGEWVAE